MKSINKQLKPGSIVYCDSSNDIMTVTKGYIDIFITCYNKNIVQKQQISLGRFSVNEIVFCFNNLQNINNDDFNYRIIGRVNTNTELNIEEYRTDKDFIKKIEKPLNKWLDMLLSLFVIDESKNKHEYVKHSKISFKENSFISCSDFGWFANSSDINIEKRIGQTFLPEKISYLPISKKIIYKASKSGELDILDTYSVLNKKGFTPIDAIVQFFFCHISSVVAIKENLNNDKLDNHIKKKIADYNSAYLQAESVMAKDSFFKKITVTDNNTKFIGAIHAVAKQFGINIKKTKGALNEFESYADFLKFIGSENNFFVKQIKLKRDWWKKEGLSFLAFEKETSEPLAVIVKYDKYYYLNTESGKFEKVNNSNCDKIYTAGFTLHPVLDAEKIKFRNIVKFIFLGNTKDLFILLLTALLIALIGMFTPIATNKLISVGIVYSDIPIVFQLALALISVAIASFVFFVIKGFAIIRFNVRTGTLLQSAVIDRLFKMPVHFFRKYSAGDMTVRALGIVRIQKILTVANINAFLGGIFSISSLIMMFYYSSQLAILGLLMFIIILVISFFIALRQLKYLKLQLDLFGKSSGIAYQILNGLGKFKIMDRETLGFSKWGELYSKFCTNTYKIKKLARTEIVSESLIYFTAQISVLLMIGLTLKKKINVAEFVAFLTAFGQFSVSMKIFTSAITSLLPIKPLYDRIKPILETAPEITNQSKIQTTFTGNVELHNLTFRYTNDSPYILNGIDVKIEPGEFIAIVGPSGVGKSTLFRLILGLEKPEQGSIFFDGQDISCINLREFRRSIGVVNQNARIIPGNIYENITGGGQFSEEDAWKAAELAGLKEDIEKFPMKMHTVISDDAGTFSGGQKQRMVIARALIKKPKILLFDEATSSIDNKTQRTITENLNEMNITRIVIAHRLSTIKSANRIYVIKDAKISESGNFEELMKQNNYFSKLVQRQLI